MTIFFCFTSHETESLSDLSCWFLLYSLSTDCIEIAASNSSSIVVRVFTATGTSLLSQCLGAAISSGFTIMAFRRHVTILCCWFTLCGCEPASLSCLSLGLCIQSTCHPYPFLPSTPIPLPGNEWLSLWASLLSGNWHQVDFNISSGSFLKLFRFVAASWSGSPISMSSTKVKLFGIFKLIGVFLPWMGRPCIDS
jgi:hypothetical protein